MASSDFRGKTALVTGGGSGIGRALALELTRQGAQVAITDIDQERLDGVCAEIGELGGVAHGYRADHTSLTDTVALRDRILADLGAIDILCLNAGVAVSAEFTETSIEDWEWVMGLNLWGTVYMLQEFLPHMIERKGGHILITASLAGLVGLPTTSAYSASKFAVVGLAESLRAEMGPHGIGVSTLCPGVVRTKLIQDGRVSLGTQGLSAEAADRLWQRVGEDPETVARRAVAGLRRDRSVIPSSFPLVTVPWLARRVLGGGFSTLTRFAWTQQDRIRRARTQDGPSDSREIENVELAELLDLSGDELDQLYESAATPDVTAIEGDYEGLLLEGHLPGVGLRFPLRWINQGWLPWKGKAFRDPGDAGGSGYNRFILGGPRGIWKFRTRVAPSQYGGQEACIVDYDVDGNATIMRRTIFDEVKQLDDGVMLGKGGIRVAGRDPFTFYWAIAPAA